MNAVEQTPVQPESAEEKVKHLEKELKKLKFENQKMQKRILFLGIHCDALSRLLEKE